MLSGLALVSATGACVVEHHKDPAPAPPVQPRTCISDITLDGSTGAATPTKLGPLALDQNGVSVCLHLDATRNLVAAHFSATTDRETGTTSSFATVLEDAAFATLQDGWDVTFGNTAPLTFENLEWNAPLHVMTDAVLWVRAPSGAGTTTIDVALFEPFE